LQILYGLYFSFHITVWRCQIETGLPFLNLRLFATYYNTNQASPAQVELSTPAPHPFAAFLFIVVEFGAYRRILDQEWYCPFMDLKSKLLIK